MCVWWLPDPPMSNPNILNDTLPPPPDSELLDSETEVSVPLSVDLLYSLSLAHALVNPYVLLCVFVKLTPEIYICKIFFDYVFQLTEKLFCSTAWFYHSMGRI